MRGKVSHGRLIHIPSVMARLGYEPEDPMVELFEHLAFLNGDLDEFLVKKGLSYKAARDPFTGKLYYLRNKILASQKKINPGPTVFFYVPIEVRQDNISLENRLRAIITEVIKTRNFVCHFNYSDARENQRRHDTTTG